VHRTDLRAPLRPERIRPDPSGGWQVRHIASAGSTNADLVAAAAAGAPDRTVLVADLQTAGRGRLGRSWQTPAGAALTVSILLRPRSVPPSRRGWVGALLGLAALTAVRRRTGLPAELKWPNDLLIGGRKVAGILAELTAAGAMVVGLGLNVSLEQAELPRADATSLLLAGAQPESLGREQLLAAVLDALGPLLDRWDAAGGDVDAAGLRAEYLAHCVTVGTAVTIQLPDGARLTGTATDVAPDGSIVIDSAGGPRSFTAGDVVHLRPGPDGRR
jgi:BirA family biotin operon repressor/biotin-[acetyl-CoA-carboxylase] ligase